LIDRKALREALASHEEAATFSRGAVTRAVEILEEAAAPGVSNLARLSAHAARKRHSKTVSPEDVDWALAWVREHGFAEGSLLKKGPQ